ncbi:MAG: stage II sporulation protein R [Acutalibacteraceae bacterium]|nr:stage II sporulation protein R [Acutalibacteraceae bacterium]
MFKKLSTAICLSLVISVMLSLSIFDAKCNNIKNNVLRLHIIANSDSQYDQEIKAKVRNRLVSENLFDSCDNYNQAVSMAENKLDDIKELVLNELKNNNCNLPVKVEIKPSYFDTRVYDKTTLPAGEYNALKITIGKGEGRNWWCVMFPSLCLPTVSKKDEIKDVVNENTADITKNSLKYKPAFKVIEWYEQIKSKF